jgi:hypothetical protein
MALGQNSGQKLWNQQKCTLASIIWDNEILTHTSGQLDHRLFLNFLGIFLTWLGFSYTTLNVRRVD